MLLNVLIADDEYFIRKRLIKVIDWDGLGLRFMGEAETGGEAIERLAQGGIDILLLDIEMPGQSGISVAEYLFENKLPTKTIILSGYNKFEYARQALRFQAFDYLLKPVDKEALSAVLRKCAAQITAEIGERRERACYSRYLRRDAVYRALQNSRPPAELYADYPELAAYPCACFAGIFCQTDPEAAAEALIEAAGCDMAEIFRETENAAVVMLFCTQSASFAEPLEAFLEAYPGRIFLTLGRPAETEWCDRYQTVCSSLARRFFYPPKQMIAVDGGAGFEDIRDRFLSVRKNLVLCLNTGDFESFCSFIDNLFSNIGKTGNPYYLNLILTELILTFQVHFPERAQLPDSVSNYAGMLLEEEDDMEGLRETIKSLGLRCIGDGPQTPSDGMLAGRIRARIDAAFTDSMLSVSHLAKEFSLNPAYLGSVFKKATGQSVVQYITARRMEKARALLEEQSFKITQVAEMVGYSDVFYFSKRFKKYYGCPPSELTKLRV